MRTHMLSRVRDTSLLQRLSCMQHVLAGLVVVPRGEHRIGPRWRRRFLPNGVISVTPDDTMVHISWQPHPLFGETRTNRPFSLFIFSGGSLDAYMEDIGGRPILRWGYSHGSDRELEAALDSAEWVYDRLYCDRPKGPIWRRWVSSAR